MAATDPYYPDNHPEDAQGVCNPGYVRVMCWQSSACLQIRENIVQQSQLMSYLATGREAENPSECIHMANELATADNLKIICDWLAKHIEFAGRDAPDEERRSFDRRFFLLNAAGHAAYDAASNDQEKADILDARKDWLRWRQDDPENEDPKRTKFGAQRTPPFQRQSPVEQRRHRTYEEIQQIMFVANFLELIPTQWHQDFAQKENERIAQQPPGPFQEYGLDPVDKFADSVMEICCHHLGDMILGCLSPVEMQHRFPTLIGAKVLTAKDRYDILTADLWIHGDAFVQEVVPELQALQRQEIAQAQAQGMSPEEIEKKFGQPIADWTLESTLEQRAFMKDIPGFQDKEQPIEVPAIKINPDQPPDEGFEIGAHWWG